MGEIAEKDYIPKFDEKNYPAWSKAMMVGLGESDMYKLLDGTIARPDLLIAGDPHPDGFGIVTIAEEFQS